MNLKNCNKKIYNVLIVSKRRLAFTLAEILIVLTIIGVVASLTIPALLNNINDAELKTAFKKNYAVIEQATRMIATNNSGSVAYLCDHDDNDCFANQYGQHLATVKTCYAGSYYGNCWHNNGNWKYLSGGARSDTDYGNAGFILSNGALLNFYHYDSNCTWSEFQTGPPGSFLVCGVINIDVNGFKLPNVIGKDIFRVYLLEYENKPSGVENADHALSIEPCNTSNSGWSCAAKVLQGN